MPILALCVGLIGLAVNIYAADPNLFKVYSDAGIPNPPAEVYTWAQAGCAPTYNGKFADTTAPEGVNCFQAAGPSCAWIGWGVFGQRNMSGFAAGDLKFCLKSTRALRVELEGPKDRKTGVTVPSTGGDWKEIVLPVSLFVGGVDLGHMYGLFLITSTDGPATFYVDDVRWVKPAPVTTPLVVRTNGLCPATSDNVISLQPNQPYMLAAAKYTGYVFRYWSDGTGRILTNGAKLKFVMEPDLVLVANYVDVLKPTLRITVPGQGQRMTSSVLTVHGMVKENGCIERILYQLNNDPWQEASPATNWTADVTMTPGLNTIRAYGVDAGGDASNTNSVTFTYVVTAPVMVGINGQGKIKPDYNGKLLEIGKTYAMSATPGRGFAFANWTGSLTTKGRRLVFVMTSNLNFTATFLDVQRPSLIITAPRGNQKWSNFVFTVRGTTKDNVHVTNIFCQLNDNQWTAAESTNSFTNWTVAVWPMSGPNTVRAYAVDSSGNRSRTNKVTFKCFLKAPLVVKTTGHGTVTPDYTGQLLDIGKTYTMTATPNPGFAFVGWTGSLETNTLALTFLMTTNLSFTASFVDVQKPTTSVVSPTASQRWSNELFTITGTANDNVAVSNVFYQLNDNQWTRASTSNGWTNWFADVTLTPGSNSISVCSVDVNGNVSATNEVVVACILNVQIVVQINGRGTVSPNYDRQWIEVGRCYSMTATPVARFVFSNWTGSLTDTNATLTFVGASNLTFNANFDPNGFMLGGIDFSPYVEGQDPRYGVQIPEKQLRQRMAMLAPYSEWIRTFGCTHGLEKVGKVAHELHFSAAIGAWLSRDLNANEAEITNLIQVAKQGDADLVIVGSEVLLRSDLTEDQLRDYLARVKQELPDVPVTTADTYGAWLSHTNLMEVVDMVFVNYYPYWEGVNVTNAIPMLHSWHKRMTNAAGAKPVIVSETGWPSDGNAVGKAVPSPENASFYFNTFISWALSNNVPYFYFDAFDESWKAADEGPQGAHWGVWDKDGNMKPGMRSVFDADFLGDNWSGREVPGGPGTPSLELTYVPPYGSFDNLEGQVLHVPWEDYAVVVYLHVSSWWVKPTYANPLTSIQIDGTWICDVTTGGVDQNANEYAVFVVPVGYSPPLLGGAASLPAELDSNSVTKVIINR